MIKKKDWRSCKQHKLARKVAMVHPKTLNVLIQKKKVWQTQKTPGVKQTAEYINRLKQ